MTLFTYWTVFFCDFCCLSIIVCFVYNGLFMKLLMLWNFWGLGSIHLTGQLLWSTICHLKRIISSSINLVKFNNSLFFFILLLLILNTFLSHLICKWPGSFGRIIHIAFKESVEHWKSLENNHIENNLLISSPPVKRFMILRHINISLELWIKLVASKLRMWLEAVLRVLVTPNLAQSFP